MKDVLSLGNGYQILFEGEGQEEAQEEFEEMMDQQKEK